MPVASYIFSFHNQPTGIPNMGEIMRAGADHRNLNSFAPDGSKPQITFYDQPFKSEIVFGGYDAFTAGDIEFERRSARLKEELEMYFDPATQQPYAGKENHARNVTLGIEDLNRAHEAHKLSRQAHQQQQAQDTADGLSPDARNSAAAQQVLAGNVVRDTSSGNVSSLTISRKPNV
jgi:hypothetical protein